MNFRMLLYDDEKIKNKIFLSNLKSILLFFILAIIACILIQKSLGSDGWLQNLFLSLGTGAATSAIVSLVFYINDALIKSRERMYHRLIFMKEFKYLYFNLLHIINFEQSNNCNFNLEAYIKKQHRWYHEQYKRMIAKNTTQTDIDVRIQKIEIFLSSFLERFNQIFEYHNDWKNCEFNYWQEKLLVDFYADVKTIQFLMNENDHASIILRFAYFIERLRQLPSVFHELKNFDLLNFQYNDNGQLLVDTKSFEENETEFKSYRSFHEIREKNYIEYYSNKNVVEKDSKENNI